MIENEFLEASQFLTFNLENETFAIDIIKVREVLEYSSVTKVPQTPEMMIGVINLRGSVVPVIDLRLKFDMGEAEKTVNTCIIIIEIEIEGESTMIGTMVDSVQEVIDLDSEHVEPPPRIGAQLKTDFIKGMGKYNEAFIIILNIEQIFTFDELNVVASMADVAEEELEEVC